MAVRKLGSATVSPIGLGCMNLSHAYGPAMDRDAAVAVIHRAIDLGVTHFDTAALYGFGKNEELVGAAVRPHRSRIYLASKCGMTGVNGQRVIDGRPETLKQTCRDALQRLQVEHIDLYYLHRWDKRVPVEESVGALADLVREGLVREIGLSEVSATTLRKAHAVHPIAAVQTEYSLWTRNPEVALLDACRTLDISLVAFSPLGRGFLAGAIRNADQFAPKDIRRSMPRFQADHLPNNLQVFQRFAALAEQAGCTPAQLALAWLLARATFVLPIVGTTQQEHLEEDIAASTLSLDARLIEQAGELISPRTISGERYPADTQIEIDTEELPQ